MHSWLAFVSGILVVVSGLLIFSASLGIQYYGLSWQTEVALAIILLVAAGIGAWLLYVGVLAQHKTIKTGKEALIGAIGVVTTDLNPTGVVRVLGEFWQAKAKDTSISSGTEIEVIDMDGMFLVVNLPSKRLNSLDRCKH